MTLFSFKKSATIAFIVALSSISHSVSFAADIQVGKTKAEVCNSCHGPNGNSQNPEVPALAGMPALAISNLLFFYREGNRKNPIMTPMAANLTNADMKDIAAYYAAQTRLTMHQTSPANISAGPALAKQYNCTQCHGPQLQGLQHIPKISGQQKEYLLTQLKGFKAGTRADMDGNMTSAASNLNENDMVILSDYIAGLADRPAPKNE